MTLLELEGTLPRIVSRNDTPRSRACHSLIRHFLACGFKVARVTGETLGEWGTDALYRGLWNACNNYGYRGRVRVRKSDKGVFLIRCR